MGKIWEREKVTRLGRRKSRGSRSWLSSVSSRKVGKETDAETKAEKSVEIEAGKRPTPKPRREPNTGGDRRGDGTSRDGAITGSSGNEGQGRLESGASMDGWKREREIGARCRWKQSQKAEELEQRLVRGEAGARTGAARGGTAMTERKLGAIHGAETEAGPRRSRSGGRSRALVVEGLPEARWSRSGAVRGSLNRNRSGAGMKDVRSRGRGSSALPPSSHTPSNSEK